mmetsp:Transcript_14219/g.31965  ORF Transcript_14219/g.31965 Transcript_14219/m.31965 type:complete len:216 (-) Transcript_14219:392-1039(-)
MWGCRARIHNTACHSLSRHLASHVTCPSCLSAFSSYSAASEPWMVAVTAVASTVSAGRGSPSGVWRRPKPSRARLHVRKQAKSASARSSCSGVLPQTISQLPSSKLGVKLTGSPIEAKYASLGSLQRPTHIPLHEDASRKRHRSITTFERQASPSGRSHRSVRQRPTRNGKRRDVNSPKSSQLKRLPLSSCGRCGKASKMAAMRALRSSGDGSPR